MSNDRGGGKEGRSVVVPTSFPRDIDHGVKDFLDEVLLAGTVTKYEFRKGKGGDQYLTIHIVRLGMTTTGGDGGSLASASFEQWEIVFGFSDLGYWLESVAKTKPVYAGVVPKER